MDIGVSWNRGWETAVDRINSIIRTKTQQVVSKISLHAYNDRNHYNSGRV